VNMLYRALVGESISQFRHYHSRRRSLAGLCDLFDDGTACPACPKADGTMIVTMDANFGHVRKRSSGRSVTELLNGNSMFVRDEDLKEYLLSHPDCSKPTEVSKYCYVFSCHSFIIGPYYLLITLLIENKVISTFADGKCWDLGFEYGRL
ncbi:hypothetical protein AMECASPLE_034830, partial [Ameca splendens]